VVRIDAVTETLSYVQEGRFMRGVAAACAASRPRMTSPRPCGPSQFKDEETVEGEVDEKG